MAQNLGARHALYAAKNAGRNRVEVALGGPVLRVVANSGGA